MSISSFTISESTLKTVNGFARVLSALVFMSKLSALFTFVTGLVVIGVNAYIMRDGSVDVITIALLCAGIFITYLSYQRIGETSEAKEFLDKLKRPTILLDEVQALISSADVLRTDSQKVVTDLMAEFKSGSANPKHVKKVMKEVQNKKTVLTDIISESGNKFKLLSQGLTVVDVITPSVLIPFVTSSVFVFTLLNHVFSLAASALT